MLDANLPRCLCESLQKAAILDCLDTRSLLFRSVKTHSSFPAAMQSFSDITELGSSCLALPRILLLVSFIASASSIISIIFHILWIFHLSISPLLSLTLSNCLYHTNLCQTWLCFYNFDGLGNSTREISPYQVSPSNLSFILEERLRLRVVCFLTWCSVVQCSITNKCFHSIPKS